MNLDKLFIAVFMVAMAFGLIAACLMPVAVITNSPAYFLIPVTGAMIAIFVGLFILAISSFMDA